MEYIWYIIAALGAGIGTGLVGLSAATVMVPILIVLCPSFSGETGAYQATAIALASDILGSAVTTATYIKDRQKTRRADHDRFITQKIIRSNLDAGMPIRIALMLFFDRKTSFAML